MDEVKNEVKTEKKAKVKKGVKKDKRAKRDTIDLATFLGVYSKMALAGNTAKEIGFALNRDEAYVTVKASQLRKAIKEDATATPEVKAERLAKVPKLKRGATASVMNTLDAFKL